MIALAFLVFFGPYLLVSVCVIIMAANWATNHNRNGWLWSGLAAFAMYNLVFWDLIPTLLAHKYYCSMQAGFWVYKTPDQWQKENPDLTKEELKPLGKNKEMLWDFPYKPLKSNPNKKVLMINNRLYIDTFHKENVSSWLPISKSVEFLADIKNDELLGIIVSFGRGYGNPKSLNNLKVWLGQGACFNSNGPGDDEIFGFKNFIKEFVNIGVLK